MINLIIYPHNSNNVLEEKENKKTDPRILNHQPKLKLPVKNLLSVWLESWKSGRIENKEGMEKWEDRKF